MAFARALTAFRPAILAMALPLVALPLLPAHAADKAASEACAAKLTPEAKSIYDAAAPKMTPTTDMRDLLKSTTMGLMMQGEVKASDARPSAMAAAECLRDLK